MSDSPIREDRMKVWRRVLLGGLALVWLLAMLALNTWRVSGGSSAAAGWMMGLTLIILVLAMVCSPIIEFFGNWLDDREWKQSDDDFHNHAALKSSSGLIAEQRAREAGEEAYRHDGVRRMIPYRQWAEHGADAPKKRPPSPRRASWPRNIGDH